MNEAKNKLEEIKKLFEQALESVKLPGKKSEMEKLDLEIQNPEFWNDSAKAQNVSQKASELRKEIENWENMQKEIEELSDLASEINPDQEPESATEFGEMVNKLESQWEKLEISTFLDGKYDASNTILSIHAGTGGTDASDFAEMLLRMYLRYAEKNEFKTEILEKSVAEEAGIKSCSVAIKGSYAYGYLKNEAGVHRLVRLSPFNAKNTRETSFALVEVLPEIDRDVDFEINPDDLKIDTYRAGGHGGQSVNTTDSAVRITHLPTGVVAQCQNERSQLQNREQAMKVLKARLALMLDEEHAKELNDLKGGKKEMSWGNQIRSYVLHPYKMVKDHRTGHEEGNPEKVLDGEIQAFIEAKLKGQVSKKFEE